MLLAAGADPNEAIGEHRPGVSFNLVPALHQAARRMCDGEIAALLLDHGADGSGRYNGHTTYGYARMYGNRPVAAALERAVQAGPLSVNENVLAGAAEGDASGRVHAKTLSDEQRRTMGRIIGFGGTLDHAKSLHAVGISPDWSDEQNLPALHLAAWEGRSDMVQWLLTLKPDLRHKNACGGDVFGTVVRGSENCPARAGRDHPGGLKMILEAGFGLTRWELDHGGREDVAGLLGDWAAAHPEQVVP